MAGKEESSRAKILEKLRGVPRPFADVAAPGAYRPVVPLVEQEPAALQARFATEAERAGCLIHPVENEEEAVGTILSLIAEDRAICSWELSHIPLPTLGVALEQASIRWAGEDAAARVGLTGVDAALAATGSLILCGGRGRYRAASLLPTLHVAVVKTDQLLPDLESWWASQRQSGLERTRQARNISIITGPSRTADIAMQLVRGMHGPRELHVVLF